MTQQHPIVPPPELVQQWVDEYIETKPHCTAPEFVAVRAAQWGAEQMWEACRSEIIDGIGKEYIAPMQRRLQLIDGLGRAFRPKPPTLKEEALALLDPSNTYGSVTQEEEYRISVTKAEIIRRALKSIPDEQ